MLRRALVLYPSHGSHANPRKEAVVFACDSLGDQEALGCPVIRSVRSQRIAPILVLMSACELYHHANRVENRYV